MTINEIRLLFTPLLDEHLSNRSRRVHLYCVGALATVIEMLPGIVAHVAVRNEVLNDAYVAAWRGRLRLSNALAARD